MNQNLIKTIVQAIKQTEPKTKAYDTQATVTRVEGGTAWVHIPGGVTETPVKLTISAKAGDTVQVRVSGGRAFMVGNASAPPTDDTVATGAVRQISTVRKVVEKVREVAETASRIAGNTNQYFWHTQEGTDTGAHITEIPQDEFLADPANGGGNLLARSNGIAVRDGLTDLATFGANGSTIGETDKTHLEMDYHSMQGINKEGNTYFYVSDLRNASGLATIPERFEPNLTDNTYALYYTAVSLVSVTVDGAVIDASKYSMSNNVVTLDPSVSLTGDEVLIISYTTRSASATAYTFGSRNPSATVGGMSVAYGGNVEASGVASFAGGINTLAANRYDFAIGTACKATGWASFAGGLGSKAQKPRSLAYGYYCEANAYDAIAFGNNIKNAVNHSLACGYWNKQGNYVFSVGNGTSNTARSNALIVDWSGNTTASGTLNAGAVTSYTPSWASGQSPAKSKCVVSAGLCILSFQGASVAHAADATLCTLPVGARPKQETDIPFVKMPGNVVGVIRISTAGVVTVLSISNTSQTGRIYFNGSFPVV